LIQSKERKNLIFTEIKDLDESKVNQKILVRGRLHTSRATGNLVFLIIRQRLFTVQAILAKEKEAKISKQMINFVKDIPKESIIDIEGIIGKAPSKIETTTQHSVEIKITKIFVVNLGEKNLPILMEDASRPKPLLQEQNQKIKEIQNKITDIEKQIEEKKNKKEDTKELEEKFKSLELEKSQAQKYVKIKRETRLNNRIIDLRTRANQAIFKIQSGVCQLFREFLLENGFIEIHTPKLIGGASEGGAEVFKVHYFEGFAFLAQSPQLYKQMAICADMEKVFEIGPVFRAEKSFTHRHLCEFVGLDLEMAFKEHYHEVLEVLGNLFVFIFEGLETKFKKELEIINQQYPFKPLKFKKPSLILKYSDAVKMLQDAGEKMGELEDLNTILERKLGELIKEKYDTDFYILDKFPLNVRPFYTMPDPNNSNYSNSYDFFLRGEEIMSGAQRIHDPNLLVERAKACNVPISSIQAYVDSFKYGVLPHAGGGIGLERVVMLYLGLNNIRYTSMFPRDPHRLHP